MPYIYLHHFFVRDTDRMASLPFSSPLTHDTDRQRDLTKFLESNIKPFEYMVGFSMFYVLLFICPIFRLATWVNITDHLSIWKLRRNGVKPFMRSAVDW